MRAKLKILSKKVKKRSVIEFAEEDAINLYKTAIEGIGKMKEMIGCEMLENLEFYAQRFSTPKKWVSQNESEPVLSLFFSQDIIGFWVLTDDCFGVLIHNPKGPGFCLELYLLSTPKNSIEVFFQFFFFFMFIKSYK